MDIIFIIGRIMFGMIFLLSGVNHFTKLGNLTSYAASKKVPAPKLATIGTGILLILGSLGIIFGVYVTFALWALVLFLVPTALMMHTFWKETDPQTKQMEMIAFLKDISLAGAALMLLSIPLPWTLNGLV